MTLHLSCVDSKLLLPPLKHSALQPLRHPAATCRCVVHPFSVASLRSPLVFVSASLKAMLPLSPLLSPYPCRPSHPLSSPPPTLPLLSLSHLQECLPAKHHARRSALQLSQPTAFSSSDSADVAAAEAASGPAWCSMPFEPQGILRSVNTGMLLLLGVVAVCEGCDGVCALHIAAVHTPHSTQHFLGILRCGCGPQPVAAGQHSDTGLGCGREANSLRLLHQPYRCDCSRSELQTFLHMLFFVRFQSPLLPFPSLPPRPSSPPPSPLLPLSQLPVCQSRRLCGLQRRPLALILSGTVP